MTAVPQRSSVLTRLQSTEERLRGSLVTLAARAPVELEPDRIVGATDQPEFLNDWSAFGGVYGPPRFHRTSDGWVTLAGVAKSGTESGGGQVPIFDLPAGYRPPFEEVEVRMVVIGGPASTWATMDSSPLIGTLRIIAEGQPNAGRITPEVPFAFVTEAAVISLDGISFRTT